MADCIFCRIVAGEIPATIVARRPGAVAFHDLNPQAPVHVLVIPERHFANVADVAAQPDSAAIMDALLGLATTVAGELGLSDSGYRLVANTGSDGGQTVDHLHFHL